MEKKDLILVIIGGLVLLIIGYFLGTSKEREVVVTDQEVIKTEVPLAIVNILESNVVTGLSASVEGTVVQVDGRDIKLESEGDYLVISIKERASILRLIDQGVVDGVPIPPITRSITINEIVSGDNLMIDVEVKRDGTLIGRDVILKM
jgi:hypothetical protein